MEKMRLPIHLCVLLTASLGSFGCTGAYLFNEGNLEVAQQAQAAFREADLPGSIGSERQLLEQFLESELVIVRRHQRALRDKPLEIMLKATSTATNDKPFFWPQYLETLVQQRVTELVGDQSKELLSLEIEIAEKEKALQGSKLLYLAGSPTEDDPAATCPLPHPTPSAFSNNDLQILYQQSYSPNCRDLQALLGRRKVFLETNQGLIGELAAEIAEDVKQQQCSRAHLQKLANAYKAAKKQYDDAVKASKPTDLAVKAKKVKEELEAWTKEAAEIGKVEPLQLDSLVEALDEAQNQVSEVLDAVITVSEKGPAALNPESSGTLRLFATLSSIATDLDNKLNPPDVSSLLLESEHLRLQRELANRRLANANFRLQLRDGKYRAMIAEIELLSSSRAALKRFLPDSGILFTCPEQGPLVKAFGASTDECKAWIAEALLAYANSWDAGRALQRAIDQRLIAAQHDAALDSSEIALEQWNNLIGVPLTQLVALHGAGIKPAEIGNLVQALGLGAIAANVD